MNKPSRGGAGNDMLHLGGGEQLAMGEEGRDTVRWPPAVISLLGGNGADRPDRFGATMIVWRAGQRHAARWGGRTILLKREHGTIHSTAGADNDTQVAARRQLGGFRRRDCPFVAVLVRQPGSAGFRPFLMIRFWGGGHDGQRSLAVSGRRCAAAVAPTTICQRGAGHDGRHGQLWHAILCWGGRGNDTLSGWAKAFDYLEGK